MKVAINVSVKYSAGAYTATLGRCRASSTESALIAVERHLRKTCTEIEVIRMGYEA